MAQKREAIKALEAVGATINEEFSGGRCVEVDAPNGFVFKSNGLHYFVVNGYDEPNAPMSEIWGGVVEDVVDGVEKCDDEHCSICE